MPNFVMSNAVSAQLLQIIVVMTKSCSSLGRLNQGSCSGKGYHSMAEHTGKATVGHPTSVAVCADSVLICLIMHTCCKPMCQNVYAPMEGAP
jgi:hypothetical protein